MNSTDKGSGWLSQARDVAFILSIFAFFSGYAYEHSLYTRFGLGAFQDPGTLLVLVSAFDAMQNANIAQVVSSALAFVGVIAFLAVIPTITKLDDRFRRAFSTVVAASAVLSAFPIIYNIAVTSAGNAEAKIRGGERIPAAIIDNASRFPQPLQAANQQCVEAAAAARFDQCKLFVAAEDKDRLYLTLGKPGTLGMTFEIAKKDHYVVMRLAR